MFGYVNISHSTVSDEDKKLYSAYYCGLCKAIGEKSQLFRMTLSNDLTFLAILLCGVLKTEPEFVDDKRCIAHPIKRHTEILSNHIIDYVSDMNILLVYLKVCDDVYDDKGILDYIKRFVLSRKAKAVEKKYPKISEKILNSLKELANLEKENCSVLDEVADCFSKLLEAIFTPDCLGLDEQTLKVLGWMGYNIGRWIYIIDAYADIQKDKKMNSYNPFLSSPQDKEFTNNTLLYTLANVANAYDLLKIYRNKTLIENFIFSGLPEKQEYIFTRTEEKNGPV